MTETRKEAAIPESMVPWSGGDSAPADWDGGEVLLRDGSMGDGNVWDHHPSREGYAIVAYTPKPAEQKPVDLREGARLALMYLETGFIECEQCGHEIKTKTLDAVWQLQDALSQPSLSDSGDDRLRRALTPSGDTKAAYMGEFKFDVMVASPDEDDDEPVAMPVYVPWTTIKEIMAAVRERASVEELDEADCLAATPRPDRRGGGQCRGH